MTDAQRKASIARHSRFLTTSERAVFEPTEAERLAIDHAVRIAKQNGSWDRIRDQWAIRQELNQGGRHG